MKNETPHEEPSTAAPKRAKQLIQIRHPLKTAPAATGLLPLANSDDGTDEVLVDLVGDDAVVAVGRVRRDEGAEPARRRPELAAGPAPDQVQVGVELAAGLDVDVDGVQVALDDGDQAREPAVAAVVGRRRRPVDHLVDRHQGILILDGRERGRGPAAAAATAAPMVAAASRGGVGAGGGGAAGGQAGGEGVLAEVELPLEDGVAGMGGLHVLVDAGDGDVEVEAEAEDGAGDEDDEDGEGGVLEVGHLDLHGAELDAPPDVGARRRRLEPHVLPVGALDVLEVVRLAHVELLEVLAEDHDRVPDEQVCEVRREPVVHPALDELRLDRLVDDQVRIHILLSQTWVSADVRGVRCVA